MHASFQTSPVEERFHEIQLVLGKDPPPLSQLSLNKSHVFLLDLSWVQFLAPGQFSFLSRIVLERGVQDRGRVVDVVYWGCCGL